MNAEQLELELLAFVNERLLRDGIVARPDTRLFEDGHLNSMRVLDLVAFIEKKSGRKVPDRGVRLANFRSVRDMARAFGGSHAPAEQTSVDRRHEYHTSPERFASPLPELRRLGLLDDAGAFVNSGGLAGELFDFFDASAAAWGRSLAATDESAGETVEADTLARAGFLSDFPHLLVRNDAGAAYAPAACYHCYARLRGATLDSQRTLGIRARCRRAETELRPMERLSAFTMREIVVLGAPRDVERVRRRLLVRVDRFVTALLLDGAIEPASDPFFAGAESSKALSQRAGELKLELRLTLEDGRSTAVASFNRHHDYFGRRFEISLADGSSAHSACVAFGLERWVLAFLTQHGINESHWPERVRTALNVRRAHVARSC